MEGDESINQALQCYYNIESLRAASNQLAMVEIEEPQDTELNKLIENIVAKDLLTKFSSFNISGQLYKKIERQLIKKAKEVINQMWYHI